MVCSGRRICQGYLKFVAVRKVRAYNVSAAARQGRICIEKEGKALPFPPRGALDFQFFSQSYR